MDLKEIYASYDSRLDGLNINNPKISFEVFPPKDGNISKLFDEVRILKKYNPAFVSLTYGANGGNRNLSLELLKAFIDLELNVMPHFTCVGTNKIYVQNHIKNIEDLGIVNILALRGDKTEGMDVSDFKYANELVDFIHQKTTLSIGVAGYPEGHIECESLEKDIENLKRKIDAGAQAIFTQLFFNNDKFYKYVEMVRSAGITVPIIPGIMPVRSVKQLVKMTSLARVEIPKSLIELLEQNSTDAKKIGIDFAITQCQDLVNNGVCGLHFYTLNHSDQVSQIIDNIIL